MTPKFYEKMLAKAYNITKNWQDAEDVMQTTILNMLKAKNVDNKEAYFSRSVFYNSLRLLRINKKYVLNEQYMNTLTYTPSYKDPFITDKLLKSLTILSKKQLAVIKHVLEDGALSEYPGNKNSVKSHYFFGVQKLKHYFEHRRS